MLILALALQAASLPANPPPAASSAGEVPQRFSVLVPVANEPCVRDAGLDVVVCADALPSQKLPYPEEYTKGPMPTNPYLRGTAALAAKATPCAASQWGCQVGFGPPIMPLVAAAASAIGDALKPKPDKRGRVPIPLEEPAPQTP